MAVAYRILSNVGWGEHDLIAVYEDGKFKGNALRCYTDQYDQTISLSCEQFRRALDFQFQGVLFEINKNGHKIKLLSTEEVDDITVRLPPRPGTNGRGGYYWVITWNDIVGINPHAVHPIEGQTTIPW